MKAEIRGVVPVFKPIELVLNINSQEEADRIYSLFNCQFANKYFNVNDDQSEKIRRAIYLNYSSMKTHNENLKLLKEICSVF